MHELGLEYTAEVSEDEAFLKGRRADIIVNGKKVGVFGEIHPEVITAFDMDQPVSAFEFDLRVLYPEKIE